MNTYQYAITRLGEFAILIQVDSKASHELLEWLLAKKAQLQVLTNVEVVTTYNEILVKSINPVHFNYEGIETRIHKILNSSTVSIEANEIIHKIPVCYHPEIAPDLEDYASKVGLDIKSIINLHTAPVYPVHFVGFLPGFPYLEGLNSRLFLNRKETPSQHVASGSVAIGGTQTGIYPQQSPGGWHVIGKTPLHLFDISKTSPALIKAGDKIQFTSITLEAYNLLSDKDE